MAVIGVTAGKSGITSNLPQLKQALDAYVKVRNQSTYESVLEKMQNIAFKAAKNTAFSERANIASSILNLPNKGISSGNSKYVGMYKLINWERKLSGRQTLGGGRPRTRFIVRPGAMAVIEKKTKARFLDKGKKMAGKSKGFIKARQQGSKWLRIGWALASEKLGKPFTPDRGDFGPATMARLSGQKYGGGASIKISGAGKYEFEIFNGVGVFDHRFRDKSQKVSDFSGKLPLRPASDVARARAIQEAGLLKGINEEIKNMAQVIIARTAKIWKGESVSLKQIKAL
jgi:hypothetical protein